VATTVIVETGTLNAIVETGTLTAIEVTVAAAPTGGIQFVGDQGTVDLRGISEPQRPRIKKSRPVMIRTVAKVSRQQRIRTTARLIQDTTISFVSKISQNESVVKTLSKLATSHKIGMSARLLKESVMKTRSEPDHAGATNHLKDTLRKEKLKKIRKLFREYKDTTTEQD